MLNYQLILKQYGLTSDEYKQLYNSLVRNDLVRIPFSLNLMDRIINRLKYQNKSMKKVFKNCPGKFQFSRILRPEIRMLGPKKEISELSYFKVYGGNLHLGCEKIWSKINVDKIINYNYESKIRDYFYSKCMDFVPEYEKKLKIYTNLFWNYAEYEAYRITEIIKEVGKEKCKRYIIPKYLELEIENHEVHEAGKIDCIHLLTNDEFAIVDYKYGKVKYYNPAWDPNFDINLIDKYKYDKREIDFELGSYYNLVSDIKNVYKTKNLKNGKKELVELEYMDFKKGLILYLRDWKSTFHYIPLNVNMFIGINIVKSDIIQAINKGYFPLRPSGNCFEFCEYVNICMKDKIWRSKFNEISPNIRNKLQNVFG